MHQGSDFLFVYGTLRRGAGHAMGEWLGTSAEWQGEAWCEGARLYRVSWYPALVPGREEERVRGDLYRLRDAAALWPALDAFEGVTGRAGDEYGSVTGRAGEGYERVTGRAGDEYEGVTGRAGDEYERRPVPVRLADGRRIEAWCYWYRREVAGLELLPTGNWLAEERPPSE
ncbi:MAG: gamma-glutamylcyclotransferase [Moraxellaceae bacterium]|jgi:gamma-glutamylcyclotransferase (GGCT)/AIG2-like uncharacterized protein YtfP|nr:gamma-glutamylcyclotransferase [Moraxellaceae bacterium]